MTPWDRASGGRRFSIIPIEIDDAMRIAQTVESETNKAPRDANLVRLRYSRGRGFDEPTRTSLHAKFDVSGDLSQAFADMKFPVIYGNYCFSSFALKVRIGVSLSRATPKRAFAQWSIPHLVPEAGPRSPRRASTHTPRATAKARAISLPA